MELFAFEQETYGRIHLNLIICEFAMIDDHEQVCMESASLIGMSASWLTSLRQEWLSARWRTLTRSRMSMLVWRSPAVTWPGFSRAVCLLFRLTWLAGSPPLEISGSSCCLRRSQRELTSPEPPSVSKLVFVFKPRATQVLFLLRISAFLPI